MHALFNFKFAPNFRRFCCAKRVYRTRCLYGARYVSVRPISLCQPIWTAQQLNVNQLANIPAAFLPSLSSTRSVRCLHTSSTFYDEVKVVQVPAFAESVSEGDVRFEKAVGDSVQEDEVVAEIETDKTSVPVPSPVSGVIERFFVDDGATVKPGVDLFSVKIGEIIAAARSPSAETPSVIAKPTPTPSEPAVTTPSTPSSTPSPSAPPPQPASIPTPPIPASIPAPPAAPVSSIPVAAIRHAMVLEKGEVKLPPTDPSKEITGTRTEQRVKMNRMRQRIAQRLKDAQNTNAMLTTFNEIDMTNVMQLRQQHNEAFVKKHAIKLGFMSAFAKAAAYALTCQPVVNAVIDDGEIVYRDYVDLSVAVASPKGLVVPVLRNVEGMTYLDIEKGIAAMSKKAMEGTLAVEDMDGGTFTISNGGVFGSLLGTPIINPPQSAILGMHAIVRRPVALNDQVVIRPMMYVALTYDHRLIDGREAVTFLRQIKSAVEDPRVLLLGI